MSIYYETHTNIRPNEQPLGDVKDTSKVNRDKKSYNKNRGQYANILPISCSKDCMPHEDVG